MYTIVLVAATLVLGQSQEQAPSVSAPNPVTYANHAPHFRTLSDYGNSCVDGKPKCCIKTFFKAYCDEFKWLQDDSDKKCDKAMDEKKDDKTNQKGEKADEEKDGKSEQKGEKSDEKKDDKKDEKCDEQTEKPRRALPAPFAAPPFPNAEYQGFPLVGVPTSDAVYPLMKAISALI